VAAIAAETNAGALGEKHGAGSLQWRHRTTSLENEMDLVFPGPLHAASN
jgi:hypothetical protein